MIKRKSRPKQQKLKALNAERHRRLLSARGKGYGMTLRAFLRSRVDE